MSGNAVLWLPAIAAVGYVVGALFLKRAIGSGATQAQVNVAANVALALSFQGFWIGAGAVDWSRVWQPALPAALFLAGQLCIFRALRHGEVSVATPLLGTKVLFTALFAAALFAQALPWHWWLAAAASSLGVVYVTGATWGRLRARLREPDAVFSFGAAATYALCDVLITRWAGSFGSGMFFALMFGMVGLGSVALTVGTRASMRVTRPALGPLLSGAAFMAAQNFIAVFALALHASATAVNIVYSSRALWSVVLAWLLARFFAAPERRDAPEVLRRRLIGALLLMASVAAVLR